jgi:hypothetical protein
MDIEDGDQLRLFIAGWNARCALGQTSGLRLRRLVTYR